MRKQLETIESVKKRLENIKGKEIEIAVNRGRRKFLKFDAQLKNIYPSVFTVISPNLGETEKSYSYTEVLCGNVKIFPKQTV